MSRIYLVIDESGWFDKDDYDGYLPSRQPVVAFNHVADARSWIESNAKWDVRFGSFDKSIIDDFMQEGESPKWRDDEGVNGHVGMLWFGAYYYEKYDKTVGCVLSYYVQGIELY